MNMMEEFRSQDEWRHIWWMIEKENTLNWWSHQNSWISIKLQWFMAKVRLVIALSPNNSYFDISEKLPLLVWAAPPRGSYWGRKQTRRHRERGNGREGKKRMRTATGVSRVSLGWSDLGPALSHTGPEPWSSKTNVFMFRGQKDKSFILIVVQSRQAICFSYIGQFDAKAASKHFNLSWHFHRSRINPHSRPPDNFCNFHLYSSALVIHSFRALIGETQNILQILVSLISSPLLSELWLLHFLSILPFSSSWNIPFSDFSSLNIHSEIIEVRIENFTRNLQFPRFLMETCLWKI